MDIDLSKESPCGHGTVTCFSLYGGVGNGSGSAEVCNFAADPDATPQDQLWVDTMLDGNQVELTTLLLLIYWLQGKGSLLRSVVVKLCVISRFLSLSCCAWKYASLQ